MSKSNGTIFRWAGSKLRIRDRLLSIMLPEGTPTYKRWISPFLGAGSIELTAMDRGAAQSYLLADINPANTDFLLRWLSGAQTTVAERARYDISSRDKLVPAVALPYLHILFGLLRTADLRS